MSGDSHHPHGEKHDFDRTPEPGSLQPAKDLDPTSAQIGETFVVQQHHATGLHHDFRLEMLHDDGTPVLVSWAVPKRLPLVKGKRHLAIRTEDHPIDYAHFSGTIERGNYGAGEVRIYDRGRYHVVERSPEKLNIRLEGVRLRGTWHLVHTRRGDDDRQWLASLSDDERPRAAPLPELAPMMATLAGEPFDDPTWSFEPKWDGIRALAVCRGSTRLMSRNGNDVTDGYPELGSLHTEVVANDAVLDGEVVAFESGIPSFQMLQQRMHVRDPKRLEVLARQIPVVFMVFDILYIDGQDVTSQTLDERRRILEACIVPTRTVQLSPIVIGDGTALFEAAARQSLEGVMAKRRDSVYRAGTRSKAWLKLKVVFDADAVIVGWTPGEGRRRGTLGALLLGMYDGDGSLRYVGSVGTGFDENDLAALSDRLAAIEAAEPPLHPSEARPVRGARWVRPELVAVVEYRQVTESNRLRAPSFVRLRTDKPPDSCTIDQLEQA